MNEQYVAIRIQAEKSVLELCKQRSWKRAKGCKGNLDWCFVENVRLCLPIEKVCGAMRKMKSRMKFLRVTFFISDDIIWILCIQKKTFSVRNNRNLLFGIIGRLLFKQISEYFEPILSKFPCGFRKGFSAQDCLLAVLEKWNTAVGNKRIFGSLITDLSKVFDCLPHDLLLAKLNAYGFSLPALRLVQNCLSNRRQRTTINSEFSSWEEILFGVP